MTRKPAIARGQHEQIVIGHFVRLKRGGPLGIVEGARHSRAGANRLTVVRSECGTAYPSLTIAAKVWNTNTSNIARAIRRNAKASGSRWSYHADSTAPSQGRTAA